MKQISQLFFIRVIGVMLFSMVSMSADAQDTLVLKSGRRVPFLRMQAYEDVVRVKDYEQNKMVDFLPDSILGYSQATKEEDYFLIFDPSDPEQYLFVERILVGPITLYSYDKSGLALFAEKDGDIFEVYSLHASSEDQSTFQKDFVSLVSDDMESASYVSAAAYRHKQKEIELVVEHYNRRNHLDQLPDDDEIRGTVYLYRTRFQKTKDRIFVTLYGEAHDLYIEDFIQLEVPVRYPAKVILSDRYVSNEVLLTGELEDQFYEVLYDKRTKGFRLDPKDGTELHFEFYGIKDKVYGGISNE